MMKKDFVSVVKVCVLVLLMMCLLFVPACKKSDSTGSSNDTEQQDTNASRDPGDKNNSAPGKLVPLEIKLPKPMFVGTPKPARVPNLEPRSGKRPPFLVPPGVKNVSFQKPVTSTDPEPIIGDVEMITDGDKEAADGCYVEFAPLKQSVTIDLEAVYEIYAILVWHYHKVGLVYYDVVVQVADDPDFITNVRTLFNNDIDNSSGLGIGEDKHYVETNEGKLIDAKGCKARYVRLYSNGNHVNDYNNYIEVEVFGRAAK
ncbi:MAG: hypothetical protein ACYS1A_15500 [Planctomycetota bacterium]